MLGESLGLGGAEFFKFHCSRHTPCAVAADWRSAVALKPVTFQPEKSRLVGSG